MAFERIGLFGKRREKDHEAAAPDSAPEAQAPKAAAPSPAEESPFRIAVEPEGVLMKLWRKYGVKYRRPDLHMDCGGREAELLPNDFRLSQERLRLKVNIDREARRTLAVIEELEKAEELRRDAVRKAAEAAAERGEPVAEDVKEEEAPSLDAACTTFVSGNGMVAWMLIFPPWGPKGALKMDDLVTSLKEAGVTDGVNSNAMAELLKQPAYFRLVPVAVGTPVVEGEDGKVEERFKRVLPKEIHIDEMGRADYKAAHMVQVVEQGGVICDIIPPVEGTPGRRVDGKEIRPHAVKPARPRIGANTKYTEDGSQIVSNIDGHVEYTGDAFWVKPVLEIHGDVDYSSGNIDFWGDVHIHGDVRETFSVRATGTITIDGLVEAATVEAGSDVVVASGILGDNHAFVKCGGKLHAKYLENCVVYAGESVIADCIMVSQVFSDGTIEVTSGRGTIIGGSLTAAKSIKALVLGSQSGRGTEITLGMLPYVQSELISIEDDLEAVHRELESLDKNLKYLAEQSGLEGADARAAKARMRKSVLTMKEQKLVRAREKLKIEIPDLTRCRLEAATVYPSTTVEIQGYVWRPKDVKNHCILGYDVRNGMIYEV